MSRIYQTEIEVRGYELDSYGHVNHANYLNYLEFARWKMLEAENVTLDTFKKWGRWPVIAQLEIQYLRPAFMGDRLTVETRLLDYKRSSMQISQAIKKGDVPITQAKIRSVIVDESGRPAPLPEEGMLQWKRFFEGVES